MSSFGLMVAMRASEEVNARSPDDRLEPITVDAATETFLGQRPRAKLISRSLLRLVRRPANSQRRGEALVCDESTSFSALSWKVLVRLGA